MAGGKKQRKRSGAVFPLLFAALLASVWLSLSLGRFQVPPEQALRILCARLLPLRETWDRSMANVVLNVRLPRVLASVFVGSALSASGCTYQSIFKNPLVSPEFLGVSSGAGIGAAAAILLSLPALLISVFAFVGGIVAVLLTVSIPALIKNRSNIMLVLSGIIVGSALSSVFGFIKYVADPDTQLAPIIYWTMGSFAYIQLSDLLAVLAVIVFPAALLVIMAWWIDVLSLGEAEAQSLGANVHLVRSLVIICATLLTAGSVCIAGTIGWVGLVVPHLCRLIAGSSNRRLIPLCALVGGLFMLLVDTLTRIVGIGEMPVSVLTGIIGAPFYCWLLYRQRRALS